MPTLRGDNVAYGRLERSTPLLRSPTVSGHLSPAGDLIIPHLSHHGRDLFGIYACPRCSAPHASLSHFGPAVIASHHPGSNPIPPFVPSPAMGDSPGCTSPQVQEDVARLANGTGTPRERGPAARRTGFLPQVWANEALLSVARHSVECRIDGSEKGRTPVLSSSFLV